MMIDWVIDWLIDWSIYWLIVFWIVTDETSGWTPVSGASENSSESFPAMSQVSIFTVSQYILNKWASENLYSPYSLIAPAIVLLCLGSDTVIHGNIDHPCYLITYLLTWPRVWNTLPASVRNINSHLLFRKLLKAFHFVWRPRRRWRCTGAFKYTYLLTYLQW